MDQTLTASDSLKEKSSNDAQNHRRSHDLTKIIIRESSSPTTGRAAEHSAFRSYSSMTIFFNMLTMF